MAAEIVRLSDPASGATADILISLGFNCFSWVPPFGGEPRELLWAEPGFEAGDKRPSRSGIPLLAPFAGRIRGGAFSWQGKRYELPVEDGMGNAIHGFALRSPWRVVDRCEASVAAEFHPPTDNPSVAALWPGDLKLTARYTLSADTLAFTLKAENLGDEPSPFGFGTHAYFRLPLAEGTDPESTLVRAAVDGCWATEGLIPTGDCEPLAADHELPVGAMLAGREFDTPYRFVAGGGVTELIDAPTGRAVRQTYDDTMTACVIYVPDHREAICLEPYTCLPNPFELEDAGVASGLRVLGPGESYDTRLTLEATDAAPESA